VRRAPWSSPFSHTRCVRCNNPTRRWRTTDTIYLSRVSLSAIHRGPLSPNAVVVVVVAAHPSPLPIISECVASASAITIVCVCVFVYGRERRTTKTIRIVIIIGVTVETIRVARRIPAEGRPVVLLNLDVFGSSRGVYIIVDRAPRPHHSHREVVLATHPCPQTTTTRTRSSLSTRQRRLCSYVHPSIVFRRTTSARDQNMNVSTNAPLYSAAFRAQIRCG